MKTIYKSIALEAALLSVTLALQAEIQSEGQTVTADVQASTLDRLKVTLVSPNVSGARDLVASGNATIEGNEIAVNLENLAFGTHRLIVSARFGTQIRTLYALDISVPQAALPTETQEYEDAAIVVSTYGDGGGGGEFPTDYAKQGDDPTATLTDTQAYAQAAAEAAQSLIAVDADIFAGKQALATNISAKGVPTSVSDALTTMATKVLQIPQQINTRTSEFEQIIAPSPYMWNVYTVATDLMKETLPQYIPSYMSSGVYAQYRANNAFFVGEYYRGYDSLELTGADGYLTHDGCFYTLINGTVTRTAPDGTVTTYEGTTIIHTWLNDTDDTYFNRWVAFFYLTNAYSFINANDAICPRRAALCGSCDSFIVSDTNRLASVWVIGTLLHFEGGTTGDAWDKAQVLQHYTSHELGYIYTGFDGVSCVLPDLQSVAGGISNCAVFKNNGAGYIYLPSLTSLTSTLLYGEDGILAGDSIQRIIIPNIVTLNGHILNVVNAPTNKNPFLNSLKELALDNVEVINVSLFKMTIYNVNNSQGGLANIERIYMPKLKSVNANFVSVSNGGVGSSGTEGYEIFRNLKDLVVGELATSLYLRQWNATGIADKSIIVNNIKEHFLANVSDRTGLSQCVLTVGTNLYNAIASETITWHDQTMTLADAFLTKNWLLAGA